MSRTSISQSLTNQGWTSASEIAEKLNFVDLFHVNKHNTIRLTEDVEAGLLLISLIPLNESSSQGESYFWVGPTGLEQEDRFCEILENQKAVLDAASIDSFVAALEHEGIRSYLNYPGG